MKRLPLVIALLWMFPPRAALAQGTEGTGRPDAAAETWRAEADPPLLPPPADTPPTSTSGVDVGPLDVRAPTTLVVRDEAAESRKDARLRSLEERIAENERRIRRLEERTRPFKNLTLSAYVQPQLLLVAYNAAASPNRIDGRLPDGIGANDVVARADGGTTNSNLFRLRRTRLRTTYETDVMRLWIQIDVLPAGGFGPGIGTIVRNAEATGKARFTNDVRTEFTAGMFFVPFRAELLEPSNVRPFIERTWFIQNALPTERDIGAHARTFALGDKLILDLGFVNGQRLGERFFVAVPDLNKTKDFVGQLSYKFAFATLGANAYVGRGQVVDATALRVKQFSRWAINYHALLHAPLVRGLGETRVLSELAIAQNMDTGVFYPFAVPRIPAAFTDETPSLDERAFYARVEQDFGKSILLGYRYDMYTPDTSLSNNARDTHAFVAVIRFSENLRLMNQVDWAIDNVHAPGTPAPSKHIVSFSSVLQAGF